MMALLPGTFWLYQGEELGLPDGDVPPELAADPLGIAEPSASRDGARTPMPWTDGPGLGFSTGQAWLPDGNRKPSDTVAVQLADPLSHLQTLSRLLAVRNRLLKQHRVDGTGAAKVAELDDLDQPLSAAGITDFRRGSATVLVNLGDQPTQEIELPADAVFDSDDPAVTPQRPRTGRIRLAAQQALLLDHTPK